MSSGEPRSAEPRLRPLPAPPAERRSVRLAPRARALAALRAIDRREVGLWVAAAALTSIVLVPVLRLWRADLSVPFDYGLDAKFGLMVVKAITDHGWYQPNSSVGAPYGQQLYDFPLGPDHVNFALVKLMTLFTSDAPAVFNLFYLLSFPMTAFASVVVLRRLGLSRGSALVASVLFAFLPYHFFKGERHLLLAAYTAVPVGCLLLLRQLRGEPLFARSDHPGRWRSLLSRRTLATLALAAFVGASGGYYVVFTVMLVAAVTVVGLIAGRGVRELARGGVLIGVVLLVFAINLTPSLVYWAKHGRNVPAERTLQENERLTLRLTDMVLPVSNHRIDALADLKHEYEGSTLFQERAESKQQALGVFGVLGFGFVVAAALAAAVRRRGSVPPLAAAAGVVALIAFAIGTAGGLSSLAALLLTEGIRSWARIGMYVAFVALLGFGILLDALRARLGGIRGGGALFIAVLAVALVVGVLDETTNERVPAYTAVAADFRDDDAFVSRVEDRLPDGAMVYQLPYLPFPEAGLQPPPSRMEDYDPLRGYLHSHDLRWSYGAMKGRPSDWAGLVAAEPVPLLTAAVASAGFDGIEIDRFGYGDNGADLEARLGATLDVEPIVSENGRLSFFDLRPYTARLRSTLPERTLADLRALTLKPLQLEWRHDFFPVEHGGGRDFRWSNTATPRVEIENPRSEPRVAIFSATLATRQGAPAGVLITWPDGSSQRVNVSSAGAFVRRRIRIPPAKSTLAFASDAQPGLPSTADPRTLYLAFIDARLVDVELLGMQRRFTARRLP